MLATLDAADRARSATTCSPACPRRSRRSRRAGSTTGAGRSCSTRSRGCRLIIRRGPRPRCSHAIMPEIAALRSARARRSSSSAPARRPRRRSCSRRSRPRPMSRSTSRATISSKARPRLQQRFPASTVHSGRRRFRPAVRRFPAGSRDLPKLGFFPGSTIGNFVPRSATDLLRQFRELLGAGALLLIGMDRVKPVERLIAAYDDPEGVTAAFNLNLLERINRELDGDIPDRRLPPRSALERHPVADRDAPRRDARRRVHDRRPALPLRRGLVDPHREQPQIRARAAPALLLLAGGWTPIAEWTDAGRRFRRSSWPRPSPTASPPDCAVPARARLSARHAHRPRRHRRPTCCSIRQLDHHHPGDPQLAVRLQRPQHQLAAACAPSSIALDRITAPLYRPIRRMLPDFGGIDFSPLVVLILDPGAPEAARRRRRRSLIIGG